MTVFIVILQSRFNTSSMRIEVLFVAKAKSSMLIGSAFAVIFVLCALLSPATAENLLTANACKQKPEPIIREWLARHVCLEIRIRPEMQIGSYWTKVSINTKVLVEHCDRQGASTD